MGPIVMEIWLWVGLTVQKYIQVADFPTVVRLRLLRKPNRCCAAGVNVMGIILSADCVFVGELQAGLLCEVSLPVEFSLSLFFLQIRHIRRYVFLPLPQVFELCFWRWACECALCGDISCWKQLTVNAIITMLS